LGASAPGAFARASAFNFRPASDLPAAGTALRAARVCAVARAPHATCVSAPHATSAKQNAVSVILIFRPFDVSG
jgi:hypothetical protein